MKHRGVKFLSLLLTLAMVVGMMPGMSLTAYAEDTTVDWNAADIINATGNAFTINGVTLVAGDIDHDVPIIYYGGTFTTTLGNFTKIEISADYAGDVSGTGWSNDGWQSATWTGNAASVSFSDTIYGGGFTCDGGNFTIKFTIAAPAHTHSFTYSASGAAITATCTAGCPDGYNTNGITLTISAPTNLVCDGNPKTATISGYPSTAPAGLAAAPTSISYNPGGTAPTTPGTYTASFTWGGATASVSFTLTANAYTVTLTGGTNATASGGETTQSVTAGQAMTTVYYTATTGNHFAAFADITNNGITATRTSDTVVTVSGTPTANATITVPNATAVPTFTVTYIANNGTGETKVYTPAVGQTHNVEGQLFPAPQDKEFNNWLGDDGNTYLQGAQINTNRTLTAQWKDKSQGGGSHGGNGSGADIVFNIPGVGDGWEYVGGYAPQRAYRVSFAPMQGGSAYFALNSGETGETMNVYPQTTVWVRPTPAPGYRLASIVWSMIDGSASYDITQAQNFVMPAMDVVVYVTFQPVG